jgi:hypothetical protein
MNSQGTGNWYITRIMDTDEFPGYRTLVPFQDKIPRWFSREQNAGTLP